MSLSSDVARDAIGQDAIGHIDVTPVALRYLASTKRSAKPQLGLVGRSAAITILVTLKRIGCRGRALSWNRQASIILDLVLSVCVFAGYCGKASAESSTRELKHHRPTVHKVHRYVRHHPHLRHQVPIYATGPSSVDKNAALSVGPGRYLWKRGIVTTIFWVGERPGGHNPVPNLRSSWDRYWAYNYGGYDNPEAGSRRNFIPIKFVPRQNPFYFALPYNDVAGGHTKYEASRVIPWFKQAFVRDGRTVLKDRWIAVRHGNKVCYAQWEDCGPFRTDDWRYVFGDERPRPNLNQGAGLDVSPAVRDYLGLGVKDPCDWKFVEYREVPHGPWAMYGDNNTFVILGHHSNERLARE